MPYIAVSKNQVKRDPLADFYGQEDIWLVKKDEAADAQVLLNFINKRLDNNVPLKLPFLVILFKNLILFLGLGTMIILLFKLRPFLIDPRLWLTIAMISYIICLSGVVYNIIHVMPVFRFDQD